MEWRPFKLLNASELDYLATAVEGIGAEWAQGWLRMPGAASARCKSLSGSTPALLPTERWLKFSAGDASLWLADSTRVRGWVGRRMLGGAAAGAPLASEVLEHALTDLITRFFDRTGLPSRKPCRGIEGRPEADACRNGSGAATCELTSGDDTLSMVLAPALVSALLAERSRAPRPARPAPLDPRQCLDACRVTIEVGVGEAQVEIGVLHTLAVGDVVALEARVDEPLALAVGGRATGRRAFLGCQEGVKAVALTTA